MDIQTGLMGLYTLKKRLDAQSLLESELPLPDGRDAAETLLCTAVASVEETRAEAGRVRVTGRVSLQLVCRASGGDTYAFEAASSFTHTIECAEAEEGMQASARVQVLECAARPDGLKLRLTAILEVTALVTAPVTTPFITEITGGAIEVRKKEVRAQRHTQLGEASVRVRDELPAEGTARILLSSGAAEITALRFAGSATCEVEGTLHIRALSEDDAGAFVPMQLEAPFACAVDAPYTEGAWAEAEVQQLSLRAADLGFGVADADATVLVRLFGVEQNAYSAVADAYDEAGAFSCERVRVDRLVCAGAVQDTFRFNENVLIPKHLPDAATPVYAACMPVVTGLCDKEGKLAADIMLLCAVLYRAEEGTLHGFTEDIPVQAVFDAPYTPGAEVRMTLLGCEAAGSGRTLKLRCALSGTAVLFSAEPDTFAAELTRGSEPCPYAGVLIYCADAGETLWDVGKRFRVPAAALSAWNPGLSEPLAEGQAIVLVR